MRLTNRNARVDKAGKHNDRNFELDSAIHIDQTKLSGNKYTSYFGEDYGTSFRELELDFYERNFSEYLEKRNKRHIKNRHTNRTITMEQYLSKKQPEDKVIQIGSVDKSVDPKILWECAKEYMDRFNDMYGEHCKILNMALHVDESTPHVHIRRVWIGEDEDGFACVNQEKALALMGIKPPREDIETSRFNNAKMTFTKLDGDLLMDVLKEHQIEVEKPRKRGKQNNLTIQEFKDEKERIRNDYERDIQKLKNELMKEQEDAREFVDAYLDMILNSPLYDYDAEIEKAKEKGYKEKYKLLLEFFKNEKAFTEDLMAGELTPEEYQKYKGLNKDYRTMSQFIKEKGLDKEFNDYKNQNKVR